MSEEHIREIEQPAGAPAKSPANAKAAKPEGKEEDWKSFGLFLIKLVIVVLLFRTLAFTSFNIPSQSMMPRLLVGDHLFAQKWSYGYSTAALPFGIDAGDWHLFQTLPERGDVVIFKHPMDRSDYIKRVIGLPGDTVQMVDGVLYLNDAPVPKEQIEDFVYPLYADDNCNGTVISTENGPACSNPQYRETLPGGASYNVLDLGDNPQDNTAPVIVPEGQLFVMGDNRDNSQDSRFPAEAGGGVGLLPVENLVGEASFMYWSWGGGVRWSRMFKGI